MVSVKPTGEPFLDGMLARHPRLVLRGEPKAERIEFESEGRVRTLSAADPSSLYGLIEYMDNNPVVCADAVSVPGPAATLLSIAIGPVAQSGLLEDEPVLVFSGDAPFDDLEPAAVACGWERGLSATIVESETQGVLAMLLTGPVSEGASTDNIQALFEERYGRSFYVRQSQARASEEVAGRPWAVWSVRVIEGLLSVHVAADRRGKCGACQLVHAANVMFGWEETLGIDSDFGTV